MGDDQGAVHSRTFTWHDPDETVRAGRTMSGLDLLRAMLAGELPRPPIAALMGFAFSEVEEGRVVFTLEPAEYHYNPIGTVHGGVAATLLDSAMGCAVNTLLPLGTAYTTLEIKVNYIRPMTRTTGLVRCEGTVIHRGGTIATAEGRITDADGKLYAHATTTCLIMRG
jgi:uncharacterized protein (TIGR00369 family)